MKWRNIFKKKNQISIDSVDDILLKALIEGETIGREEAMTLPVVFKAVDFICGTIAMIPIKLYRVTAEKKVEEIEDTRVNLLNDDTQDTLDGFQFKKAIVEDYLLDKGGYAYINKMRNSVKSINYIEPKHVSIFKNEDPIFKSYHFNVNGHDYKDYQFIKLLRNTKDGASGKGVTEQVSKAIETAYQTMLYQLVLLKTGGNKKGFLKSENSLSQEAIDKLKKAWKKLYSNNESNVVVLNKGLDFKESSSSSVEMQLNESKNTLNKEIDGIFHIKDNYSDTFKEAISPILSAFECALNRNLLLEKEKKNMYFAFDLKETLKGTLKERFEAYKTAKETGWITLNEIRYLEDYDSIDGLDIVAMSLGNVIYDTKEKKYYTPNTDSEKKIGEGGDGNE